ncbi:MAG: hypothetical protein IPH75_14100 [bacterium]|nr:hypothetical protein [bacterium]
MRRWAWLAILALMLVPMISFSAVDVQLGTTEAYWYPGDNVKIPIIMTNDVKTQAFTASIRILSGTIVVDSVVRSGRLGQGDVPIAVWLPTACDISTPSDSGTVIFVSSPSMGIPIGSGEIASIWMHGYSLGSQFTFQMVDSFAMDPADPCYNRHRSMASIFKSSYELEEVELGLSNTTLTLVDAALELTTPATVSGMTLKPLSIPVDVWSLYEGVTVEVISFEGPNGQSPFPTVSGAGPWQLEWTPGLNGAGAYLLTVRASNPQGQHAEKSIAIAIGSSVLSGDIDCNGNVDLSDLSRMINWLLNHTVPPLCP